VSDRAPVSFWFPIHGLFLITGRVCSGFPARPAVWPGSWPDPTRPGPAPGACPWRPHFPPCAPPLSLSFFPAQQLPSPSLPPLFHPLCPRCDPVDGCLRSSDPEVSSPSLPLASASFLSPCTRPQPAAPPCAAPARGPGASPARSPVPARASFKI
jgi:hypothetical protein